VTVGSGPKSTPRRPRALVALAFFTFLYATMGLLGAWSTAVALSSSEDQFIAAARKETGPKLGFKLGTPAEQERIAERMAKAFWSRRRVRLPLAGATAIASLLLLLGAARAVARGGRHAAWGRSAWQLGALVGLPAMVLESLVSWVHSRDLQQAIADLHDPLAEQLRTILPMRDAILIGQVVVLGLFLGGVARYLGSKTVVRYCSDAEAGS
jgi:hypothetical protein